MSTMLYQYSKKRPSNQKVQHELGLNQYLFITATRPLAQVRHGMLQDHQCFADHQGDGKKQAAFPEVMRGLVKRAYPNQVASRTFERIALKRAIDAVAGDQTNVLKKDLNSLLQTLKDLAVQNVDLSAGLPPEWNDRLLDPCLEELLPKLQAEFYHILFTEGKGRRLFEQLAREYLDQRFALEMRGITIVMESFTFLTPLQRRLVEVCDEQGIDLSFLIPNNQDQAEGFEIIERTYSQIPNLQRFWLTDEEENISQQLDLRELQYGLFSTNAKGTLPNTKAVQVRQYATRDQEVIDCIRELQKWFADGYKPCDVAIVIRHRNEFMHRLSDLMQLHQLKYIEPQADGTVQARPVTLPVSPRLLLLTPVGRFVLTLYEIWKDGVLHLEPDQFEVLTGSGWLGNEPQDLTPKFRALKHQFFTRCRSRQDWENVLDILNNIAGTVPSGSRLPVALVTKGMISKWKHLIAVLEKVCSQLFSNGQDSIAKHILKLREQLEVLLPNDEIRMSERAVLEKVFEVFQQLVEQDSIDVSTEEFSDTLHALVRDHQQPEDSEAEDGVDDDSENLKVYTPEAIDGIHAKFVYYVGADSEHVPAHYAESWPFFVDGRDGHMEKERYMFLTTVRAAEERLVISYALQDADRSFQPGVYLSLIEEFRGEAAQAYDIQHTLDLANVPVVPSLPMAIPSDRTVYDLHEVAHYGLCPARYQLEMLHPEARLYRNNWQLSIIAQGEWLRLVYERLRTYQPSQAFRNTTAVEQSFERAMNEVEPALRDMFLALSPIEWYGVRSRVKEQLDYHLELRGTFLKRIGDSVSGMVHFLNEEEERIEVKFEVPLTWETLRFPVPVTDVLMHQEWLLPADSGQSADDLITINGVEHFATLKAAKSWWEDVMHGYVYVERGCDTSRAHVRRAVETYQHADRLLKQWVKGIQDGHFPKHQGTHCNKCPMQAECLGGAMAEEEMAQ